MKLRVGIIGQLLKSKDLVHAVKAEQDFIPIPLGANPLTIPSSLDLVIRVPIYSSSASTLVVDKAERQGLKAITGNRIEAIVAELRQHVLSIEDSSLPITKKRKEKTIGCAYAMQLVLSHFDAYHPGLSVQAKQNEIEAIMVPLYRGDKAEKDEAFAMLSHLNNFGQSTLHRNFRALREKYYSEFAGYITDATGAVRLKAYFAREGVNPGALDAMLQCLGIQKGNLVGAKNPKWDSQAATATIVRVREALGTYHPLFSIRLDPVELWKLLEPLCQGSVVDKDKVKEDLTFLGRLGKTTLYASYGKTVPEDYVAIDVRPLGRRKGKKYTGKKVIRYHVRPGLDLNLLDPVFSALNWSRKKMSPKDKAKESKPGKKCEPKSQQNADSLDELLVWIKELMQSQGVISHKVDGVEVTLTFVHAKGVGCGEEGKTTTFLPDVTCPLCKAKESFRQAVWIISNLKA